MAQSTCTSPASLKVTSVAAPGACEPRLNSLPLLVERMLCGMVSSLTKVSDVALLEGDVFGGEHPALLMDFLVRRGERAHGEAGENGKGDGEQFAHF